MSNLKFSRKDIGKVHIDMRFVRGKYNISDGLGGRRGAAYYPLHGGDIFFDDAEEWSLVAYDSNKSIFSRETNLMKVAIHELGHALGLEHSKKNTSLMEPGGTLKQIGELRLDVDDVQAIQALYGAPGLPRPQNEDMEEVDIEAGNRR